MSEESVKALMIAIGAVWTGEDTNEGDAAWRLELDESVVDVELKRKRGILRLSAELGPPPESRRHDVCMLALLYNQTWNSTGGARIDWLDGRFCLRQDISVEASDEGRLASEVDAFASKRAGWGRLFEQMPAVAPVVKQTLEVLSAPGLIKS
jgi:hypothetical protein